MVKEGNITSTTLTLNTGAPLVLGHILNSLFTHDCVVMRVYISFIRFADDTTVVGLILLTTMRQPTRRS